MARKGNVTVHAAPATWSEFGAKVDPSNSPEEMLKKANLDWSVSKRPVYYEVDGQMKTVEGQFALARDTDNSVLSMVGASYKPVQNDEAIGFFSRFVEAGDMEMEAIGALRGGRYIWGLAKMKKEFKLGKDDLVGGHLLLTHPHLFGFSLGFQFMPIRFACYNVLPFALGNKLRNSTATFRMPHSREFTLEVKQAAEEALGLANNQMAEFQEAATLLSNKSATDDQVDEFFNEVLKFNPKEANKNQDGTVRIPRMKTKFANALKTAPGQALASAEGTWWGALNAVTYVIDHETGRSRDTAMHNSWMGYTAGIKRDALQIALKKAA